MNSLSTPQPPFFSSSLASSIHYCGFCQFEECETNCDFGKININMLMINGAGKSTLMSWNMNRESSKRSCKAHGAEKWENRVEINWMALELKQTVFIYTLSLYASFAVLSLDKYSIVFLLYAMGDFMCLHLDIVSYLMTFSFGY